MKITLPRLFFLSSVCLFGGILFLAVYKKGSLTKDQTEEIVIALDGLPSAGPEIIKKPSDSASRNELTDSVKTRKTLSVATPPDIDRIDELFRIMDPKLPIVKTLKYKSRVDWMEGRPAWLADYASHYKTSRHFIARSLHQKPDYENQEIKEGQRFNVFDLDKDFEFYLLIDLVRSKMWFYYVDNDSHEKILLKVYPVGLGRPDSHSPSSLLTPIGKYSLGSKVAIYKPKMKGYYQGKQVEMIQIFGSRWIPFDQEIGNCSHSSKGYGIHGLPWLKNEKGELVEDRESLCTYASDGCIRLATEDIEELFSIIITKPTTVELVEDYFESDFVSSLDNPL